eukprot:403354275
MATDSNNHNHEQLDLATQDDYQCKDCEDREYIKEQGPILSNQSFTESTIQSNCSTPGNAENAEIYQKRFITQKTFISKQTEVSGIDANYSFQRRLDSKPISQLSTISQSSKSEDEHTFISSDKISDSEDHESKSNLQLDLKIVENSQQNDIKKKGAMSVKYEKVKVKEKPSEIRCLPYDNEQHDQNYKQQDSLSSKKGRRHVNNKLDNYLFLIGGNQRHISSFPNLSNQNMSIQQQAYLAYQRDLAYHNYIQNYNYVTNYNLYYKGHHHMAMSHQYYSGCYHPQQYISTNTPAHLGQNTNSCVNEKSVENIKDKRIQRGFQNELERGRKRPRLSQGEQPALSINETATKNDDDHNKEKALAEQPLENFEESKEPNKTKGTFSTRENPGFEHITDIQKVKKLCRDRGIETYKQYLIVFLKEEYAITDPTDEDLYWSFIFCFKKTYGGILDPLSTEDQSKIIILRKMLPAAYFLFDKLNNKLFNSPTKALRELFLNSNFIKKIWNPTFTSTTYDDFLEKYPSFDNYFDSCVKLTKIFESKNLETPQWWFNRFSFNQN